MKPHSVKTAPGCIFTLLLFVLTVTFLNPSNALSQDADHYFRFGMELKEKGSYEEAVEAFKDAIGRNHKLAEAYNQLALCYLLVPYSAAMLKRANDAAVEARRLDWDNKEYVYTLADVYFARNFLHDARRLLDNILNDDPGDIPSLSRFAKYKLWEYEQYRYRRDRLTIRFRVASSHLTEANQFMDRVLEIDPAHRETVLHKASMSLDEGNFDEFIDYMSRLLDKNKNDLEANLYMGLAYSNKGDFETALKYYDKAYILMTPEERDVLENPEQLDALIDIDSYGNFKLIPAVETEYFWDKKDPFYLTGINERKLTHYGRVAEANLRFSIPSEGIPGWQTARGIVWIKYGKPFSIRGSYNHNKFENILTWTYENFMFNFLAGYNAAWRNDYVFKIKSFMPGPWTEITNEDVLVGGNTERIVIDLPEKYVYDPPGELFEIAVDVLNYRGTGGKTDVDIYIGIPINKIGWESDSENYYAEIEQGIFIHDSDWNRVVESTGTVSLQFGKDDFDISSRST
ncbi:GWxTD domain-containing protein [candidate division KSB1 bacterium]|nr:GWxTD domain-containing protein [candidate division KSB1 bacterium]